MNRNAKEKRTKLKKKVFLLPQNHSVTFFISAKPPCWRSESNTHTSQPLGTSSPIRKEQLVWEVGWISREVMNVTASRKLPGTIANQILTSFPVLHLSPAHFYFCPTWMIWARMLMLWWWNSNTANITRTGEAFKSNFSSTNCHVFIFNIPWWFLIQVQFSLDPIQLITNAQTRSKVNCRA